MTKKKAVAVAAQPVADADLPTVAELATELAPAAASAVVRAHPLLKWVGGKAQLSAKINTLLPHKIRTYFEPMVGAGAVYFSIAGEGRFESAVLGDTNPELMDVLRAAKDSVEELIQFLSVYKYDKDMFGKVRDQDPKKLGLVMRAARTIYLNKTGFNGLYRLNASGKFNVPFGRYTNPRICDEPNLRAVSALLGGRATDLLVGDFEQTLTMARKGDAVYLDPPYIPKSKTANFTSYTAEKFPMSEHERLAACFARLAKKGVAVVLSNSDTPESRSLYAGFNIESVEARRSISRKKDERHNVSEILVTANTP